jgi:hypothetical protein
MFHGWVLVIKPVKNWYISNLQLKVFASLRDSLNIIVSIDTIILSESRTKGSVKYRNFARSIFLINCLTDKVALGMNVPDFLQS